MTRREWLVAVGLNAIVATAAAVAARGQETAKKPAKTATVTLAISGMT